MGACTVYGYAWRPVVEWWETDDWDRLRSLVVEKGVKEGLLEVATVLSGTSIHTT